MFTTEGTPGWGLRLTDQAPESADRRRARKGTQTVGARFPGMRSAEAQAGPPHGRMRFTLEPAEAGPTTESFLEADQRQELAAVLAARFAVDRRDGGDEGLVLIGRELED